MGRALTAAGIACTLAACGGAALDLAGEPPPPGLASSEGAAADDVIGLVPGEALAFEVRLAGVLAGEAALVVRDPASTDPPGTLTVTSRIRSAGAVALVKQVDDQLTTLVDRDGMRPLSSTATVQFGSRNYQARTTYGARDAVVEYQPVGGHPSHLHFGFGAQEAHDAHSAMARVRTWRAEPGERLGLWVLGGRRLWRTEVWAAGHEVIGTRMGNLPAVRLDGISQRARPDLTIDTAKKTRTFSVWLSDDADRVPLRMVANTELGPVTIDLVDYRRP